jgi:hypothetical protein
MGLGDHFAERGHEVTWYRRDPARQGLAWRRCVLPLGPGLRLPEARYASPWKLSC